MEITGKNIVQRIESLTERKSLIRDLGIPAQTISNWKIRNNIPPADIAFQIAEYLHVSVEWLLTGRDSAVVTEEDAVLLKKWHELDDSGKLAVQIQIDGQLESVHARMESNNQYHIVRSEERTAPSAIRNREKTD